MPKGIYKPLTAAQEQQIRDEYLLVPYKTLANKLGISGERVKRFLKRNGLEVSQNVINQRILDARI